MLLATFVLVEIRQTSPAMESVHVDHIVQQVQALRPRVRQERLQTQLKWGCTCSVQPDSTVWMAYVQLYALLGTTVLLAQVSIRYPVQLEHFRYLSDCLMNRNARHVPLGSTAIKRD